MSNLIFEAIEKKLCIEFVYEGEKCIVEPYAFVINKDLLDTLIGFQIIGESNASKPFGWKQFTAFKLLNISLTNTPINQIPREGYKKIIKDSNKIYVVLDHIEIQHIKNPFKITINPESL